MSRLDRQSFLGPNSDAVLDTTTIGIVGLGGGGSHIVQQAAHLGIGGYVNVDPQSIDLTNTNRLVGGTLADVEAAVGKTDIAERHIRRVLPNARILSIEDHWHTAADQLKAADVIVGAVDSFATRDELERFARRHLIPYVDLGMDVHEIPAGSLISGQVILSTPGGPCLRCCGFLTDDRLAQEANRYGAAGSRPQVVWSNGVLASTAIGLLAQMLSPWYPSPPAFVYLEYDGNRGTVIRSAHMHTLQGAACPHHPSDETGDPMFDIRQQLQSGTPRRRLSQPMTSWWHSVLRRLRRST